MSVCIKHSWSSHGEPCPHCDIEACEQNDRARPNAANVDTTLIGISPAEYNRLKNCQAENQRLRELLGDADYQDWATDPERGVSWRERCRELLKEGEEK